MQKQKIQAAKENNKKSSFWKYVILITLLFVGAYIIWLFMQRPSVADIRVGIKESSVDISKNKEPKKYHGKYLTFSYPGDYQELTHTTPEEKPARSSYANSVAGGPIKENIFLSAIDLEGQKIAVVVEERATGNFEESPSFQMRLLKPKEYKKEPISENGFKGFLFKKNTQVFEETAFVRKENFIISVSLSSPMNIEGLNKALMDVLRTLEWRK
jgi:hypothetical protein